MILHLENGRLGNQLFQYIGLKKYFPKHRILNIGCENLQQSFDKVEITFLSMKKIYKSVFTLLKLLIIFLTKIRFLGKIYEETNSENFKINTKRGILWKVFVCFDCYFQHKDVIETIIDYPILKTQTHKKGLNWLNEKKIDPKKDIIVFVHIRRGDYLNYPSREFPAVLDLNWYNRAMSLIRENLHNPVFILMGDDQQYLKDFFKETNSIFISNNDSKIDLSIMSFCCAGILSASSFAWWGAYYAKTSNQNNNYFIAPKYWVGYRKKEWFPKNFHSKWITYLE
jgi:hypothetical protein